MNEWEIQEAEYPCTPWGDGLSYESGWFKVRVGGHCLGGIDKYYSSLMMIIVKERCNYLNNCK